MRLNRPASPARPRWHAPAWCLALLVIVGVADWPVLGSQAIGLDDQLFVTQNPLVLHPSAESARRFFVEVLEPSTVSAYYLPLSMTSLMLDVAAGGSATRLGPFHVTSLALQVGSTVLLFLLLLRLCGSLLPAALAAIAWGVHPMMVEAIASVGERKTVLATFLALASTLAWLRGVDSGRKRWSVFAVGLFALALLAKPSVVALPLALLALDAWPLRRLSWATVVEKWPYFALALVSTVLTVLSVKHTWEFGEPPPLEPVKILIQVAWLLGFYVSKLVWPLRLSTVYAAPEPFVLTNVAVLPLLLLGVAITTAALLLRRRIPALLAGWGMFVILLAPTFGILRFSKVIAYDRYVHLPALGLAIALAMGFAGRLRAQRTRSRVDASRIAFAFVVLAECFATRVALVPWRDSIALWTRAVSVSPGVPDAHNGLGAIYDARGDTAQAIAEFERTIAVEPNYADGHQNLGRELRMVGRVSESTPHLEFAVSHSPGSATAALQLGLSYMAAGRSRDAETQFRRALALRPSFVAPLGPLGMTLVLHQGADEGLALLRRATLLAPDIPLAAREFAATIERAQGANGASADLLELALTRAPNDASLCNDLAWLRATAAAPALRDTAEALQLSARAIALTQPPGMNLLDTRAAAEASAGRFAEASATARRALALAQPLRDNAAAAEIASRLAGYERGVAFVQKPVAPH